MVSLAQVTAAATEELAPFVELLTSGGAGRGVTHNVNTYFHLISAGAPFNPHIACLPCPPGPGPAGVADIDMTVALMQFMLWQQHGRRDPSAAAAAKRSGVSGESCPLCSADGKFSSTGEMVRNQIAVLNSAYASAQFKFTLSGVTKTTNKAW